jgi:hypothetical protein
MKDIRKKLEALGYEFADPEIPVDVSGTVIRLPRRVGCDRVPPVDQPPFWEASWAKGTCSVKALHPLLFVTDFQNMPFDIAELALRDILRESPFDTLEELLEGDESWD